MISAIIGGVLIGAASIWLWLSLGRVAGISGIAAQALANPRRNLWPVLFVLGLGVGGWLHAAFTGLPARALGGAGELAMLIVAGLLVGFGTRLGSGCTSGHGVCGNARLSRRSISATLTFLAVGMATASVFYGLQS